MGSYISTMKKQGRGMMEAIRGCVARNELERVEAWLWPPLGGDTEEARDELRLPY